jgi:4-hydroxybenzoate polyprenyltransferase
VGRGVRRALGKAEVAWWLTRFYLNNGALLMIAAGWVGATDGTWRTAQFVWAMLFMAASSSAILVFNDVSDHEDDKVTAPHMPLAAGLMEVRTAAVFGAALALLGVVFLALASVDTERFLICVGLLVLATASGVVYSAAKPLGIVASVLVGLPFAIVPLLGWVAAGGQAEVAAALLAAYGFVDGLSANTQAALKDVDVDPLVGNRTLAVRIGPLRAFRFATAVGSLAWFVVAALNAIEGAEPVSLVLLAASVVLTVAILPRTYRSFQEADRGRELRVDDLAFLKIGDYLRNVALVAVYAPALAVGLGLLFQPILIVGRRLYVRRIVQGELARSLGVAPAPAGPVQPAVGS